MEMVIRELGKRAWKNRLDTFKRKLDRLVELKAPECILEYYRAVVKGFEGYKDFMWPGETDKGEPILYRMR